MNPLLSFLLKFVLPVIVLVILWRSDVWLGLIVTVVALAFIYYRNRPNYYAFKANKEYTLGNRNEALQLFEKAASFSNVNPNILSTYGYLLLREGDVAKAKQVLTDLLNRELTREVLMNARMNLALVSWKEGNLEEAIERMEAVYDQFKTTALYGSLGYLYIESGQWDKARSFNEEAYEYNDSDPVIMDNLGYVYMKHGEREQAKEIYEKLMEKKPKFPEPYYHYGLLKEQENKYEEAKEWYEKALSYPIHHLNTITKEEIEEALSRVNDKRTE